MVAWWLNIILPHLQEAPRVKCLVQTGGTVWEELGSLASLEELCRWGWALRF